VNPNRVTEKLCRTGETERVEFVASPDAQDAVARAVCALLNGNGGTVLVGVDENGAVVGEFSDQQAAALRGFLNASIVPHALHTVSVDGTASGSVLSVDIPAGRDRPYVFDGSVYVRRGLRTTKADAMTMQAMVEAKAREIERWERRPVIEIAADDLDWALLDETVRRAQDRRGYAFRDVSNRELVLMDLGLLRSGQLTNAADVLFGRRASLHHPQTRVRAVCYESGKGEAYIDEQLLEGPAFHVLESALAFLRRHVSIAAEFPDGRLRRRSRPQYPFQSLREGLVNALVHRDYASFSGGVCVSVYPDRVEIWNSGHLPEGITVSELRRETHASVLVNPDIGHVFYLNELMERVGRGTFKIVQECLSLGMKPPQWKDEASGVRLRLFAAPRPKEGTHARLNERQLALLRGMAAGQSIRTREYVDGDAAGVTERQARRDLAELQEAGYLGREGAGPTTAYRRTEKDLESG